MTPLEKQEMEELKETLDKIMLNIGDLDAELNTLKKKVNNHVIGLRNFCPHTNK